MLHLVDVDYSTFGGLKDIELSLGSELFDAMAHLAALSSESLSLSERFEYLYIPIHQRS